jgi:hypothetical protein
VWHGPYGTVVMQLDTPYLPSLFPLPVQDDRESKLGARHCIRGPGLSVSGTWAGGQSDNREAAARSQTASEGVKNLGSCPAPTAQASAPLGLCCRTFHARIVVMTSMRGSHQQEIPSMRLLGCVARGLAHGVSRAMAARIREVPSMLCRVRLFSGRALTRTSPRQIADSQPRGLRLFVLFATEIVPTRLSASRSYGTESIYPGINPRYLGRGRLSP